MTVSGKHLVLEKISPDIAAVLKRANEEARSFGHAKVGLEHLLLALVLDQDGYPAKMLRLRGLTYPTLWVRIERIFGRGLMFDVERPLKPEIGEFFDFVRKNADWPGKQPIPTKVVVDILLDEPAVIGEIFSAADSTAHTFQADTALAFGEDVSGLGYSFGDEVLLIAGDFSEAANFALLFARIDAAIFSDGKGKIDSDNILIGLVSEQAGAAGMRLRKLGLTLRFLRGKEQYSKEARKIGRTEIETVTYTPNARKIMRNARKIGRLHNCPYVTSEHLFMAILTSGKSKAMDLLSDVYADVAALKSLVFHYLRKREHEGTLRDIEYNWWLLRGFGIGPYALSEAQSINQPQGEGEPLAADVVSAEPDTFELSHLDPVAIDLMIMAFREYEKSPFVNFDCKHIVLGMLAQGWTAAAHLLAVWGVGLNGARLIVREMETLNPFAIPGKELPDDVAILLKQALSLARSCGSVKVSGHHILWALVKSIDPQNMVLLFRLGLDPVLLCEHVEHICREPSSPRPHYGNSVSDWPRGLAVLGTLCKPAVASAMDIAFDQARLYQANEVSGDFILLGLLGSPGVAASAMTGLGLQADTIRSAIFELRSTGWFNDAGEGKRLYEMLMRTSGPLRLPAQALAPTAFLAIIRRVEELALVLQLDPIIVYWSSQRVSRLLPPGRTFGRLVGQSKHVSFFCDSRRETKDQLCFMLESSRLCLILYGQEIHGPDGYVCLGSMNPNIVGSAIDYFMPNFTKESTARAKNLEMSRRTLTATDSTPALVKSVLDAWPKASPPLQAPDSAVPFNARQLLAFGADVYQGLERALEISLKAHKPVVGTEHLLRGLIESRNDRVITLLNHVGVWPDLILEKLAEWET